MQYSDDVATASDSIAIGEVLMIVMNCVCGHRIAAADRDQLYAAIRRHSDEAHADIIVPDADVREMVETRMRMSEWDGTMTPLDRPVEIRPLESTRADDFVRFFDRDAFIDNPSWASCYCLFYEYAGDDWESRTGEQNRNDKVESIRRGSAQGLLAYVDNRPVAWCNVAPRVSLPRIMASDEFHIDDDPSKVGSIVCFAVAAPYRRQGIAAQLLNAACDTLREQGLAIAEAYPAKESMSDARAYHGPLDMYLAAGFTPLRETGHYVIVRKLL